MNWFVYIALAKTGRYYTGITNDPASRVVKHNSGKGARMATQQGPFKIIFVSDPLPGKSQARKREIQVKGWSRSKKEKLIRGEWR